MGGGPLLPVLSVKESVHLREEPHNLKAGLLHRSA